MTLAQPSQRRTTALFPGPPWQLRLDLPDHRHLPDRTDDFVKNFQEHPQSLLLTECIVPHLNALHPDGQYAIGQDCGIYWHLPGEPTPLVEGAKAPDWFYVPGVPPLLDGQGRGSYVMWRELIPPAIALEFVSGSGQEERDRTPQKGKFWVYEQAIQIPYYGIYEVKKAAVEVWQLVNGVYEPLPPDANGHYWLADLGVGLGIWLGEYFNQTLPWLRWRSATDWLPTAGDRTETERQRARAEGQRAETERLRAEAAEQRAEAERQARQTADQQAEAERQARLAADQQTQAEAQRAQAEHQARLAAEEQIRQLSELLRQRGIVPD